MRKNDLLQNYHALVAKVDELASTVKRKYSKAIACKKGCSECCILTSVFPVEAFAIAKAIQSKPKMEFPARATKTACVFLQNDVCVIYKTRPIICRTHGYPILVNNKTDFCPKNFIGLSTLDSSCLLNLERLNLALAAVNLRFLEGCTEKIFMKRRIKLKDIPTLARKMNHD